MFWFSTSSFLVLAGCVVASTASSPVLCEQGDHHLVELQNPIALYRQESSAASSFSTESALRELDEIARLKKAGMRFDFYAFDASGFANSGSGSPRAPDGPNAIKVLVARCREVGVIPGLLLAGNSIPAAQGGPRATATPLKDSLSRDGRSLSLFEGSYLLHLVSSLQSSYDWGIRLFEFRSIDLMAATPASSAQLTPAEIVSRNSAALRRALLAFRRKNRDSLFLMRTELAEDSHPESLRPDGDLSSEPAATRPDLGQLGAFQMVTVQQAEPDSTPPANLLRSLQIGDDDRVRRLEAAGIPLQHIDSSGFAVGFADESTQSMPLHAWKGAFLLALARGSWVNTMRGDLKRIPEVDAFWMARVQKLFFDLEGQGSIRSFGAVPGSGHPYGFAAATRRGSVYVVVNPGLAPAQLTLPILSTIHPLEGPGRIQFRDAGFAPRLRGNTISLGPGQMAMVGFGRYAEPAYNFGVQQDVVIPNSIQPVDANFESSAPGDIEARIDPPIQGVLRVVVLGRAPVTQQHANTGPGALSDNRASRKFSFEVTQGGRPIPVRLDDGQDSAVRSNPIWLVAEIDVDDLTPGLPVRVQFQSRRGEPAVLEGGAYQVVY